MDDSYLIGIRLALDNGVSAGVATIRADLATLDAAISATTTNLRQLQSIALVPDWHRQRVLWRKLLAIGRRQPADKNPLDLGRNILEVPRQPR